ncbi:MAG: phosphonate ABC transporter, permease protein PhnE [Anaerolineae bacterium]|nr:phosphonate ABC transporter, permease protein PhnE [Anaerolineae bacterium]
MIFKTIFDPPIIIARILPMPKRRRIAYLNRLDYLQLRFFAFLLDIIGIGYVYWAWNYVASRVSPLRALELNLPFWAALLLIAEVAALWGCLGRTFGAAVMDLKLTDANGNNRPTLSQRLVRFLGWNLALLPATLGHLWALGDRAWLTWADRLSGTVVIAREKLGAEAKRKPAPLYGSSVGIALLALLLLSYVVGTLITQVRPQLLITDAYLVRPLIADLLNPDVLAREPHSLRVTMEFRIPCPETVPAAPVASDKPIVILSKTCGNFGDELTMEVFNLRPNTEVRFNWLDPSGVTQPLIRRPTDANGHLAYTLVAANVANSGPGLYGVDARQEWEEGELRLSETFRQVEDKMLETIFLALRATTLGVIFSVPVSFLAAKNLTARNPLGSLVYYAVRLLLNIMRAIEPLIWAIIFVVWVGIGPFAGVLALTLHTIAALGKLYSEAIESIDPGPIEAVTATGADRLQTIIFSVVPQVIPPWISFTIYRWDINVRMSTIIGFVGGGGIGFLLIQWINLLQYRQAATAMWAIAIVVAIMDYVSAIVRERVV